MTRPILPGFDRKGCSTDLGIYQDYAVFVLGPLGIVSTWRGGPRYGHRCSVLTGTGYAARFICHLRNPALRCTLVGSTVVSILPLDLTLS